MPRLLADRYRLDLLLVPRTGPRTGNVKIGIETVAECVAEDRARAHEKPQCAPSHGTFYRMLPLSPDDHFGRNKEIVMSAPVEFAAHIQKMLRHLATARKLNKQVEDYVVMAGLELEAGVGSSKPIALCAHELHQAYEAGASAYLQAVREDDCPHSDQLDRAAWRSGWINMEVRERIHAKFAPPGPLLIDNVRYDI